jgi:imidazolonepropionase-like amidohydrolase
MIRQILITSVTALVFTASALAEALAPTPVPVVFENVTLVPMDTERQVKGQTVVVEDGRITAIGPFGEVPVPAGATRVDGSGKYLLPGLTETHGHLPSGNAPPETVDRVLQLYLLNGVTTVRGMLGHPAQLEWREQAASWQRLSPRLVVAGPSINGNSAPTAEVAVQMVEEQKAAGYDLLKIHPGVSLASFNAMAATADRLEMPFAGHVPLEVGVQRAIAAGYASIDHLDGYMEALIADEASVTSADTGFFGLGLLDFIDRDKLPPLVEATREAGVYVNATETLMQTMAGDGQPAQMRADASMAWWPEEEVERWASSVTGLQESPGVTPEQRARFRELRFWLIRSLYEGGVSLLLGSDAPQIGNVPGFSTLRELQLMADAGLPNFEALATGTRNVGQYLGETDVGTIAIGHRADLLLLDADPLMDVSNVRHQAGVMAYGRWLPKTEIDRRLAELKLR